MSYQSYEKQEREMVAEIEIVNKELSHRTEDEALLDAEGVQ